MPLLSLLRFLFTLLSIAVLIGAAYLLWTWYDAPAVRTDDGTIVILRDDWRLWIGLVLLGWSMLGKLVWGRVLAKPDVEPLHARRQGGVIVPGAGGTRLHVEMQGPANGPLVILTHGSAADSTIWHYAKVALSDRFRVVSWDLPGYGKSKLGGEPLSLDLMADNLETVVDFVGRPVVVVGHSMGGMAIQTLARKSPHIFGSKILGIVLLNTTYTNPLRTMILPRLMQTLRPLMEFAFRLEIVLQPVAWLSAWQSYLSGSTHLATRFTFSNRVTRGQLNHASLLGTRNPPASIAKGNLAMFRWDARGALATLKVPVLVVAGEGDIVTKPSASQTIAGSAPTSRLEHRPVNHMGLLDDHQAYDALIRDFAAGVFQSQESHERLSPRV